jgi:ankyrin repeat protein
MASSEVNTRIVQLLIEHGADVTAKNETHSTPLHLASSWVSATAGWRLPHRSADMNAQDGWNKNRGVLISDRTILKTETVRLLIKHGADVTAQDEAHSTPLHLASSCASTETVRLLIEHGAKVNCNARDGSHRTPLHLVSSCVSNTTMSLLI